MTASTVLYLPFAVEGGCPGYRLKHFGCTKLNAIGSEFIVFCARSVENTSNYHCTRSVCMGLQPQSPTSDF